MDKTRVLLLQRVYTIWGVVLILWSLYRVYTRFPEWLDDLVFKPLVFLTPVVVYLKLKEKRPLSSIGLAGGKFFRDIYLGIGFGMLFAVEGVVANAVKYGRFSFAPTIPVAGSSLFLAVFIALAASFCEEVFARGFLYTRLKEGYKSEFKAMVLSTMMYFLLLVPAIFTISKLTGVSLLIFVMTNIIISLANTMIFSETKTVTVPVLIHAFWNMALALYL